MPISICFSVPSFVSPLVLLHWISLHLPLRSLIPIANVNLLWFKWTRPDCLSKIDVIAHNKTFFFNKLWGGMKNLKLWFVCLFWCGWITAQNSQSCVGPLCLHTCAPVPLKGLDTAPFTHYCTNRAMSLPPRKPCQSGNRTRVFQSWERRLYQLSHCVYAVQFIHRYSN